MSFARPRLGRVGVWSLELRFGDQGEAAEAASELDELGYSAIWVPGGAGGDVTGDLDRLLAATRTMTIATGILNIWKHEPCDVAGWWQGLEPERQRRVLLGLGVSHAHVIGDAYKKPLAAMREYLGMLEEAGLPDHARCLAALGPKMLELARERTAGVHPYLVTPAYTALAREAVGPERLVAPEQGVILEQNPARAREIGRAALAHYRSYPNYRNSWQRLGFSEEEIDTVSDHLVDALFAWGAPEVIAERVEEHFAAGADHVCIQAITGAGVSVAAARPVWRELSKVLL